VVGYGEANLDHLDRAVAAFVRAVDSPVHLFTDADSAVVDQNWQSIYGYRKVD
jgi:hypothetical protein